MKARNTVNLFLISMSILFAGVSLSLLSPFYPAEALAKGVSVTQSGLVIGSMFITTVIFTPIVGRYINLLGARKFLLIGSFICALGNIMFGMLVTVNDTTTFLSLSIIIRIITAIGESAMAPAAMALAGKQVDSQHQGKVLSAAEAFFGIGTMFGPTLGGALYDVGGFGLPFWVSGGTLVLVTLTSLLLLHDEPVSDDQIQTMDHRTVTWCDILRSKGVRVSGFALMFAGTAWSWYTASLEPWLNDMFNLSPTQTGLVFMVFGVTYTVFTPVFGVLTDWGLDGLVALLLGNSVITIGFCLMGPLPFLDTIFGGPHLWLTVVSIGLQGVGSAATYLGALLYMTRSALDSGLPDNEQTRGMVSSFWVVSDCVGGYLGSSLGSLTYDQLGFQSSTLIEASFLVATVIVISLYILRSKWRIRRQGEEGERTRLLPDKDDRIYG